MRRRDRRATTRVWLRAVALSVLPASTVAAHDCSGLSDCYGTILAAVLAVLALALILTAPYWLPALAARFALSSALRGLATAASRSRIAAALGNYLGRRALSRLSYNFARRFAGQTAGQLSRQISRQQTQLLRNFFGSGLRGARAQGRNFKIPEGLSRGTLERYHELARRAIADPRKNNAVQRLRIRMVERALRELDRLGL